jgi:hypothetical protein
MQLRQSRERVDSAPPHHGRHPRAVGDPAPPRAERHGRANGDPAVLAAIGQVRSCARNDANDRAIDGAWQ